MICTEVQRTYDEGILQPRRAHSLRHPLQEMQKTRFDDQNSQALRCVKMSLRCETMWNMCEAKGTLEHLGVQEAVDPLRRDTAEQQVWPLQVSAPHLHDDVTWVSMKASWTLQEFCPICWTLRGVRKLRSSVNGSKRERMKVEIRKHHASTDIFRRTLRSNLSETRSNPPWRVQIFFVQSMRAPKGLETESEKANSKRISTETVKWTSRLPRRKFFILLSMS